MAQLAIKGHLTRGKEVIEILEMLGGKNRFQIEGFDKNRFYYIDKNRCIQNTCDALDRTQFSLEEFLKKYPYKVGDKVLINDDIDDVYTIKSMMWDTDLELIAYKIEAIDGVEDQYYWFVDEMEFYPEQEETMEENTKLNLSAIDYNNGLVGYEIPEGYEFDTVIDNKVVIKKLKPKYPKTYEECCNVLGCDKNLVLGTMPMKYKVLINLQKLLICRDAYWKIAGEELELDGHWEPDWENFDSTKYCIGTDRKIVGRCDRTTGNKILAFPTKEMRDAFYENFKELIEQCKELL